MSEDPQHDRSTALMVRGYRLATAEILYHMPDYPQLLQSYIWQKLDLAPQFPELHKFLDFWERELDGRLHSVKVASAGLVRPARWRHVDGVLTLH